LGGWLICGSFQEFQRRLEIRVWLNQIRFEIKVPIGQNKSFQVRISDRCHEKIEGYKHGFPCFSTSFMANTKTTSQRKEARAADVLELATVKVQALQVGEMDCDFGLGLSDGFLS